VHSIANKYTQAELTTESGSLASYQIKPESKDKSMSQKSWTLIICFLAIQSLMAQADTTSQVAPPQMDTTYQEVVPQDEPTYQETASRIIAAALADSFAYGRLGELVDTFGPRFSGTQAL
jgi:hypothetical protein